MTDRDAPRRSVPRMLLRFSVPIAAFWLALAVVTNVYVPQLEKVAQAHNVSQSPQDAPALQASKRIGKVFQQFDSDSAAMIVLEGDQPLGADAHHYYDGLIQDAFARHQACPAHSGFLGGSADRLGLPEQRRQGRPGAVESCREPGPVIIQSVRGFGARHRGPLVAAAGGQGLRHRRRPAGHRPVRGGQQRHVDGHADHHRGDRDHAVLGLPFSGHRDSRAFHGDDRVDRVPRSRRPSGELRDHRAVDVLDESADTTGDRRRNGLRDLHPRPLSRSALHRPGSSGGLLHDVPRDRAHHLGLGPDGRRRGVLSALHPASLFPDHGHSSCDRRPCRAGGRADPGPGGAGHRPPFRSVRPQTRDAHPGLAAHRHRHCSLARPHSCGDGRGGADRSAGPARIYDELRRPRLHARRFAGQSRLRSRRAAFRPRHDSIPNC